MNVPFPASFKPRCLLSAMLLFGGILMWTSLARAECQTRVFSSEETQVISAYVAYYGRLPDVAGLAWWAASLEQAGDLALIIDAFGNSEEFEHRFGQLSADALVSNLYQQILARSPEAAGLDYWVSEYTRGTRTLQSIALAILDGATGSDRTVVENRIRVAEHFVTQVENQSPSSLVFSEDELVALLSPVNAEPDSVEAGCSAVSDAIAMKLGSGTPVVAAPEFGMEVDIEAIAEDIPGWFDRAEQRGINWISFEAFTLDGDLFFESVPLQSAGFELSSEYGAALKPILEEAAKRQVKVAVMLEAFAHIIGASKPFNPKIDPEKLTESAMTQLMGELAELAQETGVSLSVTEEAFDDHWISLIDTLSESNGLTYTHFFEDLQCRPDLQLSEDYSYYPKNAREDPTDQAYLRNITDWASYPGQLGHLDMMFGTASACGSKAGVATAGGWGLGTRTHQNIALMRAIQFAPERYVFVLAEDETGAISSDEEDYLGTYAFSANLKPLLERYGPKTGESARPVANLVLLTQDASQYPDTADVYNIAVLSASVVTSSLLAAGYDLKVTSTPLNSADLYYVFAPGTVLGEGPDLPDAVVDLVDRTEPVFFQLVGGARETPNYQRLFTALGLTNVPPSVGQEEDMGTADPMPVSVTVNLGQSTVELPYAGYSLELWYPELAGRFSYGHYGFLIDPSGTSAEVLLQGGMDTDLDGTQETQTALVLRQGSTYLVNGGFIHHGMSAWLANVMAGQAIYEATSYGYLTTGAARSVFFAPYDTEVVLNLPNQGNLVQFDENGLEVTPTVQWEDGRLTGTVPRFHLVIVE